MFSIKAIIKSQKGENIIDVEELIKKAKDGDVDAVNRLIERYKSYHKGIRQISYSRLYL